jgi:hypothetical protein
MIGVLWKDVILLLAVPFLVDGLVGLLHVWKRGINAPEFDA